jgi:5-methylcytosine-specific restriction endonuclease McrA
VTSVLVLNASCEPLHHVSLRRAVTLLLIGKAELVEATGRLLRAATLELPEPAIIRLCRWVHIAYRAERATRRGILARDGKCAYCGTAVGPLTLDHILPRCRGGATSWENCVAACFRCNQRKDNRTPKEAGMHLLFGPPTAPTGPKQRVFAEA